jgi:DNA-binding NtrC family response regulator
VQLEAFVKDFESQPPDRQQLWVSFIARRWDHTVFPADATLSRFESRTGVFYTLILRNTDERLQAERRIQLLIQETDYLRDAVRELPGHGELLGRSTPMLAVLDAVRKVAPTDSTVLITGETGTGKEVLARLVHAYSQRSKAPFLPFNCTATPKDMLDSQLFGQRRGSFTGAMDSFQGVIRAASGGTLFLDEIGETTLDVQPKLLRFLEASEIHPIGEAHPVRVDVRVIAATNADLEGLVAQGRFREDLFYRLDIVRLRLPPLRERRVEIPALANHYLRRYAQEFQKADLRLAEETMEFLVLYAWPGNIRQLANEMRRLAVLAEKGAVLMPEHLSGYIAASRRTVPASERVLDDNELVVRLDQPLPALIAHVEVSSIRRALEQCGGRLEETAAMLGISRKGLYLKRQRYGLDPAPGGTIPPDAEFA